MIYYIIVFTLSTVIGFIIDSYRKKTVVYTRDKRLVGNLYALLFIIFVVFVGCRGLNVGSDTPAYTSKFYFGEGMPLYEYLLFNKFLDSGFYIFTWSFQKYVGSIHLYFFVISCVFFATYLKFIRKYSSSAGWSIWILNSLGFTTFAMSTLRQSLAMSFCLLAYIYMMEQKRKAWIMLLLAFSFHVTSVIFTPMMFIKKFANDKKPWKLFAILGTTMLAAPIIMRYMMAFSFKDGRYSEATSVGGIGMIVLLLILLLMGFYTYFPRQGNIPESYYNEFIAIGFALCAFLVTRFNMAAMRLFWFYLSFAIVFIPNVLSRMKKSNRALWMCAIGIVTLYYLCFRVMEDPYAESRLLLPYNFFWE